MSSRSGTGGAVRERVGAPRNSHLERSLRAFVRTPANVVSALVILAGVAMVFVPVAWLPHDPTRIDVLNRLQGPSWSLTEGYTFGTDALGRDVLSRVVFAARWTFLVSASAAVCACVIGSLAGLIAGYSGGRIDGVISRLIDMQLAFPVILLALSVLAVAGPSLTNMVLVLVLVDWARYARVVRSATIAQRANAYVEAATALGASHPRIMLAHLLPNVASTVLVMATFSTSLGSRCQTMWLRTLMGSAPNYGERAARLPPAVGLLVVPCDACGQCAVGLAPVVMVARSAGTTLRPR